jgi:uncharacterized membrane protein (DUF373 family)
MMVSRSESIGPRRRIELLGVVELVENVVHYLVLAVLIAVAAMVLWHTALELVRPHRAFATRVTDSINGVLFVIIVMELLRTVAAHLEHTGFQLQPFLIIGIISSVRHILTIGARLTLSGEGPGKSFAHSQIELGVEAGVVLALSLGLVLVRRSSASDDE